MESHANISESRPSTADVRIRSLDPLVPPARLVSTYPLTDAAAATVVSGREQVEKVLAGEDDRLLGRRAWHAARACDEGSAWFGNRSRESRESSL